MWIAADTPAFLPDLINWGPAGVVVIGFLTGWLWAKPAVERLQKDLDRALADLREVRKEQRELEAANREIVIPALTRFVELGEEIRRRLDGGNE